MKYYIKYDELDWEEIKNLLPIEEVLEGMDAPVHNGKCRCPVHGGDDENMTIWRGHNMATCWSQCNGAHYSIIDLYQVKNNTSKLQAVTDIIEDAGLNPLEFNGIYEGNGHSDYEEARPRKKREDILPLNRKEDLYYLSISRQPHEGDRVTEQIETGRLINKIQKDGTWKEEKEEVPRVTILTKKQCAYILNRIINTDFRRKYMWTLDSTDKVLSSIGVEESFRSDVSSDIRKGMSFALPYMKALKNIGFEKTYDTIVDRYRCSDDSYSDFTISDLDECLLNCEKGVFSERMDYDAIMNKFDNIDVTNGDSEAKDFMERYHIDTSYKPLRDPDTADMRYCSMQFLYAKERLCDIVDLYDSVLLSMNDMLKIDNNAERHITYNAVITLIRHEKEIGMRAIGYCNDEYMSDRFRDVKKSTIDINEPEFLRDGDEIDFSR